MYIDNLLIKDLDLTQRVANDLGLNPSLFIAIGVIDDDADFGGFHPKCKNNFLAHISKLPKLLDSLEARNVAPLNDDQLKFTVKDVNRLNERRKTNVRHERNI